MTEEFCSLHYLRRTARRVERHLEREQPGNQYVIRRYKGGTFRWAVKKLEAAPSAYARKVKYELRADL